LCGAAEYEKRHDKNKNDRQQFFHIGLHLSFYKFAVFFFDEAPPASSSIAARDQFSPPFGPGRRGMKSSFRRAPYQQKSLLHFAFTYTTTQETKRGQQK
jgi:hypothetical protein